MFYCASTSVSPTWAISAITSGQSVLGKATPAHTKLTQVLLGIFHRASMAESFNHLTFNSPSQQESWFRLLRNETLRYFLNKRGISDTYYLQTWQMSSAIMKKKALLRLGYTVSFTMVWFSLDDLETDGNRALLVLHMTPVEMERAFFPCTVLPKSINTASNSLIEQGKEFLRELLLCFNFNECGDVNDTRELETLNSTKETVFQKVTHMEPK